MSMHAHEIVYKISFRCINNIKCRRWVPKLIRHMCQRCRCPAHIADLVDIALSKQ